MADQKKTVEDQLFYLPPPKLSKWEGFKLFMWDSERREFMGRTAESWGKVSLFYLIFYAALAAFFAVLLLVFYQTLDNFEPKWTLDESLIGNNPGLGFRPMPPTENIESTLIWFRHGEKGNWQYWADALHTFLMPYEDGRQDGEHFQRCAKGEKRDEKKVCHVDINKFQGMCMAAYDYGYRFGQPCVAIKMNRIFDWKPVPYTPGTLTDKVPEEVRKRVTNDPDKNKVWFTCEGENPADRENIGNLTYYPNDGGIEDYYFPFKNTPGYLSPLVLVHFTNVKTGVLINVECKAWAKNIEHTRMERKGSVHLELLVD